MVLGFSPASHTHSETQNAEPIGAMQMQWRNPIPPGHLLELTSPHLRGVVLWFQLRIWVLSLIFTQPLSQMKGITITARAPDVYALG